MKKRIIVVCTTILILGGYNLRIIKEGIVNGESVYFKIGIITLSIAVFLICMKIISWYFFQKKEN